ncbi:hypothetical protein, partial [Xenorhabdus griffiniae]|uniref:hypothetical protein n=1 Tax=Xenorhabdus griffiniae TaxID=351672 RepID=UPI000A5F6914
EHGNERGAQRLRAGRSKSLRGWGGGGKRGGRRPTCLQGSLPEQRKAAKEEHGFLLRTGS